MVEFDEGGPDVAEHFFVEFFEPAEGEGGLAAGGFGGEVFEDDGADVFGFDDVACYWLSS